MAGHRVCERQMVDDSDRPGARSLRWIALLKGALNTYARD